MSSMESAGAGGLKVAGESLIVIECCNTGPASVV